MVLAPAHYPHQKRVGIYTEPGVASVHLIGSALNGYPPDDIIISYSQRSDIWINYWYGLSGDDWDLCGGGGALGDQHRQFFSQEWRSRGGTVSSLPARPSDAPTFEPDEASCFALSEPLNLFAPPPPGSDPYPTALSPLFVSNCQTAWRQPYLTDLLKYISVDSYGSCFPNPDLQKKSKRGRDFKREISRRYKFHIGLENSILDDYVTGSFRTACIRPGLSRYTILIRCL